MQVDNDVSLDFADGRGPVHPQHYAFLVRETESTRYSDGSANLFFQLISSRYERASLIVTSN